MNCVKQMFAKLIKIQEMYFNIENSYMAYLTNLYLLKSLKKLTLYNFSNSCELGSVCFKNITFLEIVFSEGNFQELGI